MILAMYKELVDILDESTTATEFVASSEHNMRLQVFGKQ